MKRLFALALALLALTWPGPLWAQTITWRTEPGTTSSVWHLSGANGPAWSNSAGAIEARNAALSAYAIARGAAPVGSNDLTNKNYADNTVAGVGVLGSPTLGGQVFVYDQSHALWHAYVVGMTGDVVGSLLGSTGTAPVTVEGIQGVPVPTVPLTGTTVLTDTSGTLSWAAGGGGGFSVTGTGLPWVASGTLNGAAVGFSGDATLGALSGGNVPLTLATVNTNTGSFGDASHTLTLTLNGKGLVTAASSNAIAIANANLTAGTYGNITGTGTLTAGATGAGFTLAFGSSTMTGAVPNVNQAAQTLTGDVTGNTGATVVSAISGSSPIAITPASLSFTATTSGPGITQTTGAAASTPQSFTVTPQTFNASSTTNVTNTPGSFLVALQSPGTNTVTGTEPEFKITRAGTGAVTLGPLPTLGATYSGLWLFPGANAPTTANYALAESSTTLLVNSPVGIQLTPGGLIWAQVVGSGANRGTQLGYPGTATFAGGDDVTGLSDALTIPTAAASSGGLAIYSNAHVLETNAAAIQFNLHVTSPTYTQAPAAAAANGGTVKFAGQNGGTGTTNGGQALLTGGAPTGGTAGDALMQTSDAATFVHVMAGQIQSAAGTTVMLAASGILEAAVGNAQSDLAYEGSGSINSQNTISHKYRLFCRTNSATLVGCAGFFTTIPSGKMGTYFVHWSARDVTSVNGTNDAFGEFTFAYQENTSGGLIVVGSGAGVPTNVVTVLGGGTPPGGVNFTTTASGDQVRINVGGFVGTDNVDWTVDVDESWN